MVKTAAYVKTKLGKNLGKMLDYVGNDNRPPHYKSKNKKFLKSNLNHHDRVLDSAGVNCSSSYKEAIKEMNSTYKRFGYKKGHPQCVHTIIAFNPKDFSFSSYKDRVKALDMTKEIIKNKYPHNQSMIALQADNKKHILHTHTITCNKTLDSGKSVSHNASCERTLPYVQEVMKKNGYTVYNPFKPEKRFKFQTNKFNTITGPKITVPNNAVRLKHQPKLKTSTNEFNLVRNNKKSYVTEIKNHFASAIQLTKPTPSKSKNIQSLIKNSKAEGIQMSCFSMKRNKKTGEHEIHYYKKPPKHRAVKLPNGWARIRKTWSLKFHYKYRNKEDKLINKPITIRTSKMGAEFSPTNIMNNLGTSKIKNTVARDVAIIHHDKSFNDAYGDININHDIKVDAKNKASAMAHKKNVSKVTSSLTPTPNSSKSKPKVVSSAVAPTPKVHTVVNSLVASAKKFNSNIVDNSVNHNKFSFPDEDHLPQLVKVAAKHDHKSESDEADSFKKNDYKKYIHHQSHWLAQQEQLSGHHWITKYFYLNSPNIKVPERVMPTRIKVPIFNKFKCLGGFTMPQVLYSNNNGSKEQDDIAQNAFKQEDKETQNAIEDGATEVEQADKEDVYEEERANDEDIKILQHEQSDDGPTLS